jgi:hypothetical protein
MITIAAPASDFGFRSLFYTINALDVDQDKQQLACSLQSPSSRRKRKSCDVPAMEYPIL